MTMARSCVWQARFSFTHRVAARNHPNWKGSTVLRVTGTVARYERAPYDFADSSGERRAGLSRKARILVGDADFVDVIYPESLPEPRKGDVVDLAVVVTAPSGRVRIAVRGDWASLVEASPSPLDSRPLSAAGS